MRRTNWLNWITVLALGGLAADTLAEGKCNNVDCGAVQDICYASLDLDPLTCGLWYGCCYGHNEQPASTQDGLDAVVTVGPPNMATPYGLGGASSGRNSAFVASDAAGRVFYNWWRVGQAGRGWKQLDGNGQTNTAPAAALIGNYLFVIEKASDGELTLTQGQIGSAFSGPQGLGMTSSVGPGATSSGNLAVALAVKDGGVQYNWWPMGAGGSGWIALQTTTTTDAAPAAALTGQYLFVVIKGLDGQLYLNQGGLGKTFVGWKPLGVFKTKLAAGAAAAGDTAAVVAVAPNGHIFYNWWKLGEGAHGWVEVPGGGQTGRPAAASLVGDYLFIAIRGLDGQVHLNQGTLGGAFTGWQ